MRVLAQAQLLLPALRSAEPCSGHPSPRLIASWSRAVVGDIAAGLCASVAAAGASAAVWAGRDAGWITSADARSLWCLAPFLALLCWLFARGQFLAAGATRASLATVATHSAMKAITLVLVAAALVIEPWPGRVGLGIWCAGSLSSAILIAGLLDRLLASPPLQARLRRNVAIYGTGTGVTALKTQLLASESDRFAGHFCDANAHAQPGPRTSGDLADLISTIRRGLIDEIIIAYPAQERAHLASIIGALDQHPVDVKLAYPFQDAALAFASTPSNIIRGDAILVDVRRAPARDWASIAKRAFDRSTAAIALLVTLPLVILIAAAIKITSPGPVFFRQKRHGVHGEVISVWKFRTMTVMEDGDRVQQAVRGDKRITKVGALLRRTSLDELPQLINVLRGTMSLVGPRPHALAHNQYYAAIIKDYSSRNRVLPGITGWAQINGYRGETRTPEQMARRIEHDIWYINNWSFALDLKILLLTPIFGFVNPNAY
ncbi:MAG: undecaprenyl-phosphate glucose phosphotransferase [Hyphomicrobiales bacterium]|nr:MAG: undecaprenyl-phosphate glucose phosphotransferase [Hyphomicrobiales bacterium]